MEPPPFIKSVKGSLRFRIMLPICIFAVLFSLLFILLNNYYTSNLLDLRLKKESRRISGLLSQSGFLLNNTYLERLGKVIEGEIALFNRQGHLIASSSGSIAPSSFFSPFSPMVMWDKVQGESDKIFVSKVIHDRRLHLMTWETLTGSNSENAKLLAVLTPLDDLSKIKRQAMIRTILSGLLALVLAFTVAGFISKSVTDEVNNLSRITAGIASGNFSSKAEVSNINELKILTSAVNTMGEQLTVYQNNLIHSTKLASSSKITAAMAHEIKNPLSSIKMMIQILHRKYREDKESHLFITSILEEIDRLERLVADLNSLSKPARITPKPHFPQEVLTQAVQVMEPKLKHLNIEPVLAVDYHGPKVEMDKNRIKQVLWNLIMNGAESMPGGGYLKIGLKGPCNDKTIRFSIQDQGKGMEPEICNKIFMPFFSTKKEGVGLGLYISKEIAEAHHGHLKINTNGSGTKAILSLPIRGGNV